MVTKYRCNCYEKYCEGKLELRSHNTGYCLIEVVTKAGLTNLIEVVTKAGLTNLIEVVNKAGLTNLIEVVTNAGLTVP